MSMKNDVHLKDDDDDHHHLTINTEKQNLMIYRWTFTIDHHNHQHHNWTLLMLQKVNRHHGNQWTTHIR